MTTEDRIIICQLHRIACRNDGVVSKNARELLERILDEAGLDRGRVFEANGLDLDAYLASQPISR